MQKTVTVGLLSLLIVGCTTETKPQGSNETQAQSPGTGKVVFYQCEGDKTLSIDYAPATEGPGSVRLVFEGVKKVTLPRVIAASGERYSDGTLTWWGKGSEGFLMKGDDFLAKDCHAQAKP